LINRIEFQGRHRSRLLCHVVLEVYRVLQELHQALGWAATFFLDSKKGCKEILDALKTFHAASLYSPLGVVRVITQLLDCEQIA